MANRRISVIRLERQQLLVLFVFKESVKELKYTKLIFGKEDEDAYCPKQMELEFYGQKASTALVATVTPIKEAKQFAKAAGFSFIISATTALLFLLCCFTIIIQIFSIQKSYSCS